MTPRNIAVLSFTRMGDLIQSTPLLRGVKNHYPAAKLIVVALSRFVETAKRLPMVDQVIAFDVDRFVQNLDQRGALGAATDELQQLLRTPSLRNIDLLINLSHTSQSATLSNLLRPREVMGMHRDNHGNRRIRGDWFCYLMSIMEDRSLNPFNLVDIYRNLLKCEAPGKLEFTVFSQDVARARALSTKNDIDWSRPLISIQPGASHPARCWPPERYAELSERLSADGYQIVILGDSTETALAEKVRDMSGNSAVVLAGKTDVGSLAAILKQSSLLISNDTGTAHVAASVNTPVLGIFLGPASPKDTAPYGNKHRLLEANLPCAPCNYHSICSGQICKTMIGVDEVLAEARSMLSVGDLPATSDNRNRCSITSIDDYGFLRLTPIGDQNRECCDLLTFYRDFWLRLLSDKPDSVTGCEHRGLQGRFHTSMEALDEIQREALFADRCHREGAVSRKTPGAGIREHISRHLNWQNKLRGLFRLHPEIAPFAGYLVVHVVLARTGDLDCYQDDMKTVLRHLDRGMIIMRNLLNLPAAKRPVVERELA